jgi:23S rRNA pseudouridine2605 synthase
VRVHGRPDPKALASLQRGITVDGITYGPITATLDPVEGAAKSNTWLTMALSEGKNREIRKVLAHLGLAVTRLIRVSYGPFQLGKLTEGGVEEIPAQVVREQMGGGASSGLSRKRRR